jgi:hypothetical protein
MQTLPYVAIALNNFGNYYNNIMVINFYYNNTINQLDKD